MQKIFKSKIFFLVLVVLLLIIGWILILPIVFANNGHKLYQQNKYIAAYKSFNNGHSYGSVSYDAEFDICKRYYSIQGDWYTYKFNTPESFLDYDITDTSPVALIHISEDSITAEGAIVSYWTDLDNVIIDTDNMCIDINDYIKLILPNEENVSRLTIKLGDNELICYNSKTSMQNEIDSIRGTYTPHVESRRNIEDLQRLKEKVEKAEKKKTNYAPEIGMTKEEVLDSTWGEPKKKNISEYTWGTSEQWVYPNYRYIYFEDGIVTSIQRSE